MNELQFRCKEEGKTSVYTGMYVLDEEMIINKDRKIEIPLVKQRAKKTSP